MGAIEAIKKQALPKQDATLSELDSTARFESAGTAEFLTFGIGDEEYALDILRVQEIRQYERPTHIANSPDFVKGVINLRGILVPILDLRMKLGVGEATYDDNTVVVILSVRGRIIGAVVDRVSDVVGLRPEEIKPAPHWEGQLSTKYVTGLASIGQGEVSRMLILVDMEQLITGGAELDLGA